MRKLLSLSLVLSEGAETWYVMMTFGEGSAVNHSGDEKITI